MHMFKAQQWDKLELLRVVHCGIVSDYSVHCKLTKLDESPTML
jgi:hypothetical protein